MIEITCIACGIVFGIPGDFDRMRIRDHRIFYCPNRHPQHYPQESKEEKYKRLYEQKKQCCEIRGQELKTARASYNGLKGYVAKLKKNITD